MQDSIEDYIRISQSCKEKGPEEEDRKEVLINSHIKKECDDKAMQILHFAIEGKMRSDALLRCLPHINQFYYQDIVEERAISKLCGYPLCSKNIPDMPKNLFYISTKDNQVYDITDRKNYCSNFCYQASIHIKGQIDTTPLWLRKHTEKAHFTLLNKSERGLPGEVVDHGIIKHATTPSFTSVSAFTQISLDEAEELELNAEEEETKKKLKKPKKIQKNLMKTINENEEEDQIDSDKVLSEDKISSDSSLKKSKNINFDIADSCSKENKTVVTKHAAIHTEKKHSLIKFKSRSDIEAHICKCFKEWLTLETFIFICGEVKVKEKVNSQKLGHCFESLAIADLEIEHKKRYVEVCRKLHLREMADEKFDRFIAGRHVTNAIPEYQELKEESKQLNLKVKSFYSGELYVQDDTNFPTSKKEKGSVEDECSPAVLPLADVNSQTALRRKIFLNSLNKTVHVLLQTLQMSPSIVLLDLQCLVKTFKLRADNIVFKPKVWNYIAIVLLKILSLKNENLRNALESDRSRSNFDQWLSSLPHQDKLIDDVLNFFYDIDTFIENYILCK